MPYAAPEGKTGKRKRTTSRSSLFGAVVATEEADTDYTGLTVPQLTQVLAGLVSEIIEAAYGPQNSAVAAK